MHQGAFRIFLLGLLFTSKCLAVYLGMDRMALVQELGSPVSHAAMGAHEILLYPNGVRIELEAGKVVDVQGMSFDAKPLAVYLGMDRVSLVGELGSPASRAAMGTHEILLYPNGVRIELEAGKVVDVQGMSYGTKPPAVSTVQNTPKPVAETPKVQKPAQSEADKAAQAEAEVEKQAYAAQSKEREDAILEMEKAHTAPQETTNPGMDPTRLLVELFLRWGVMVLALKLTCLFWGVTVEWPGLMLAALADAVTRMMMHMVANYFLHLPSFFFVENGIAAIVLVIVLTKVSINRSVGQAVQLAISSKTFSLVVWALLVTTMMRSFFG